MVPTTLSVGLHDTSEGVITAAAEATRRVAQFDAAMCAVSGEGGIFGMRALSGIDDPTFYDVRVWEGRGLGGRVLAERRPRALEDYPTDPSSDGEYRGIIASAGIRGLACAHAVLPSGVGMLVYGGMHSCGAPGDNAIVALEQIAAAGVLGLHHIAARERQRRLETMLEHQKIATALHDSVAQRLFAIGVAASQSRSDTDLQKLSSAMGEIEQNAAGAQEDLRTFFRRLQEVPTTEIALDVLLEAETRLFSRATGCRVVVTRDGHPRTLSELHESLIIDTVREGLRNAVKHADARLAVVHVAYETERLVLSIQSERPEPYAGTDVVGCDRCVTSGFGLNGLRQRAELLHGSLELIDQGHGTVGLRLELPIAGPVLAAD